MYHKLKKCLNSRTNHQRCSTEKDVPKNFTTFTGKHLCWSLFSIELRPATLLKETPRKVLFCEYCEIFKNTYFKESLLLQFLLLPVNISSQGLISALSSIVPVQSPLHGLKSSPQGAQWQAPLLFEEKTNQPKMSLLVICCHSLHHSLSFVFTCCATCCHTMQHSSVSTAIKCSVSLPDN